MDRPVLYWIEVQVAPATAATAAYFEPFCSVDRATDTTERPNDVPRVDAICLEFDSPDPAKLKIIRHLKKRFPSAPLLMLTLEHSEELAVSAFRAGVFDYLVKPLRLDEVERAMHRVLAALGQRREQPARSRIWLEQEPLAAPNM